MYSAEARHSTEVEGEIREGVREVAAQSADPDGKVRSACRHVWDVYSVGCVQCGVSTVLGMYSVECVQCGVCTVWDVYSVGRVQCGVCTVWDVYSVGRVQCVAYRVGCVLCKLSQKSTSSLKARLIDIITGHCTYCCYSGISVSLQTTGPFQQLASLVDCSIPLSASVETRSV